MPSSLLITNLGGLVGAWPTAPNVLRGAQLADLPILPNAWLLAEDGRIARTGSLDDPATPAPQRADEVVDAQGGWLFPGWCDSHTHLVFAHSREGEFVDRLKGLSYEAIAEKGGGILNSARRVNAADEAWLLDQTLARAERLLHLGTTAVEIKSGYALTLEGELRMLRVARQVGQQTPLTVRTTLLGAHALPLDYRQNRAGYLDLVVNAMIPQAAAEGLADYVDVFCERGFFTPEESDRVLEAAARHGLKTKVHANELGRTGGVQVGVRHGATSVDHLEHLGDEELALLGNSPTLATLLPGTALFLGLPYAPARQLVEAGAAVALATDFNPGTNPTGNMPLTLALACIGLKLTPEEAINAATVNGAAAMDLGGQMGCLAPGLPANLVLTHPLPSLAYLMYSYGDQPVSRVWVNGKAI